MMQRSGCFDIPEDLIKRPSCREICLHGGSQAYCGKLVVYRAATSSGCREQLGLHLPNKVARCIFGNSPVVLGVLGDRLSTPDFCGQTRSQMRLRFIIKA